MIIKLNNQLKYYSYEQDETIRGFFPQKKDYGTAQRGVVPGEHREHRTDRLADRARRADTKQGNSRRERKPGNEVRP